MLKTQKFIFSINKKVISFNKASKAFIGKMLKKHKFLQKKKNGKFIWLVTKLDVSQIEKNTHSLDDDNLAEEKSDSENNLFSPDEVPGF